MPVSGGNIVASGDVLQAQLEKVRMKLQDLFEATSEIAGIIEKQGEVEVLSQKLYRIPVRKFRGGTFGAFDGNAGDMGTGSGMSVDKVTAGFYYSNLAFQMSLQTIDTTATKGQAIVSALEDTLAYAMNEQQVYDDIVFHTNGSGILTNSGSLYSSAAWNSTFDTMTFAASGDTLGVNRLREGMTVNVYNSTGASKRTTTPSALQIDHIDYTNKVVYFNGTISSGANTDILAITGLSATLTSFSSGWPLSGDSFRHGLYYANDATGSNYYLGQLKSAFTQLVPTAINAAGANISFSHALQAKDGVMQRRDDVVGYMVGIAHMAQRAGVFALGQAVSNWMRTKESEKMIDLMPSNTDYLDTFDYAGFKTYTDKRQDRSRVDFIVPKNWGRAWLKPTDFYKVGSTMIFPGRKSSGNLEASQWFGIVATYDFFCVDPGASAYIYSLAVPSGY